MTDNNDSDSIEVEPVDSIDTPDDLPSDWLELAKEPMPEDHIQTVEERIGWANINDIDDLKQIVDVLDDDQLPGEQ